MYVKFIKTHDIGIQEGEYRNINEQTAKEFEGFIEEATKEEFDEWKGSVDKHRPTDQNVKDLAEALNKQREKAEEKKKASKPDKTQYKAIDELDLEEFPELKKQGFKVGTQLLVDDEGKIIFDENGLASCNC